MFRKVLPTVFILLSAIAPRQALGQIAGYKQVERSLETLPIQKLSPNYNPAKSDYKVVIFWASWCGFCAKALKDASAYIKQNPTTEKTYSVQAISLDSDKKLALDFMKRENLSNIEYAFLQADSNLRNKLKISVLPVIYILNKDGQIVSDYRGYSDETAAYLQKRLNWYLKNESSID